MSEERIKINDVKWEKYDEKSLDFILKESESLLAETFKSFRELTNRCYYALGLYVAIFSYGITSIMNLKVGNSVTPFYLLIIGLCVACAFLYPSLMPKGMVFPGTQPKHLLIEYFENIPLNEQIKEFKIYTIVASNNGIVGNKKILKRRTASLKNSIVIFITTGLFALFCMYMHW
jgi:hypothetical protein